MYKLKKLSVKFYIKTVFKLKKSQLVYFYIFEKLFSLYSDYILIKQFCLKNNLVFIFNFKSQTYMNFFFQKIKKKYILNICSIYIFEIDFIKIFDKIKELILQNDFINFIFSFDKKKIKNFYI